MNSKFYLIYHNLFFSIDKVFMGLVIRLSSCELSFTVKDRQESVPDRMVRGRGDRFFRKLRKIGQKMVISTHFTIFLLSEHDRES